MQLVAVLREVKYLEQRGVDEIPASAAKIYEKNDTFRDYINNLDLTVKWYNKVRADCHRCVSVVVEGKFWRNYLDVYWYKFTELSWSCISVPRAACMTPRVALLLQVRQETLEVEFPLIEGQLDEIDQKLQRALQELNWNSEGAWEYIQETRDKVGARSRDTHMALNLQLL